MKITPLVASRFASDGGVMFGVVPRPLWSRMVTSDANNAIPQNVNTLLIELDDGRRGLLDLGCGNPDWFSEKALKIHGMPTDHWPLMEELDAHGVDADSISFVILTHLHWDHAGGVGRLNDDGEAELTFPNALHMVHAIEYYDATTGNPIIAKAYPDEVWQPLTQLDEHYLRLIQKDDETVLPGIRYVRTGGHSNGHAAIVFEADTIEIEHLDAEAFGPVTRAIYPADVLPTQHHLRMAFCAAYDNFPLDTRRWKTKWLPGLAESGTAIFFDHDPELFAARIQADAVREYAMTDKLAAPTANTPAT